MIIDPRSLPARLTTCYRAASEATVQLRVTRQTYDAAGRLITQQDPRLPTPNSRTTYSLSGKPVQTDSVDAGWRLVLSGDAGQAIQTWDGRDTERHVEYDALLRPVVISETADATLTHVTVLPAIVVERFTYGGPQATEHNQCNQLMRHDDPAGTRYLRDYSVLGAVLSEARHFMLETVMPDWPLAESERDTLVEIDALNTRWAFNALGEAIEQTDAMGNRQHFSQTVAGQLKSVDLTLASAAQPQVLVRDIRYNAFGQTESETAGNGVIRTARYRAEDGLLLELHASLAGQPPLQYLKYDYDPVANILHIEDVAQPIRFFANQRIEPINHYRYDTLYQLIEATGREIKTGASHGPHLPGLQTPPDPSQLAHYTQTYNYDAAGNLLEMHHVGAQSFTRTMRVAPDSNRSLPEGDVDVDFAKAFDANGNLQQLIRGQTMNWDRRNQLRQITLVQRDEHPSDTEIYIYDGNRQRCRKISSAQTSGRTLINEVRYLPGLEIRITADGEILHVISTLAGRSSVRVLHWQAGQPAGVTNNQLRYSLDDHLGSSTLELDTQSGLISQESYYPFGGTAWWAARSAIEAKYKTIRYSGKERDASGLYYYGLRYYAPWLQRWINPDSQTLDGLNLYAMVRNSPMTRIDPDGANSWDVVRARFFPIRVKTISEGVISVRITGNNAVFEQVGMDFDRPAAKPRTLTYLSLDNSLYAGKVSGGNAVIKLSTASGAEIHAASKAETAPSAYINGGFFNMGGSMAGSSIPYASVGKNLIDGIEKPFAAPPKNYRDDYVKLTLHDGSFIHTAPELTMSGIPRFSRKKSVSGDYQYFDRETSRVGELGHAGDPNARTGISLPHQDNLKGRTRLAIGLNKGRNTFTQKSDEPGYTMFEWGTIMARLDNMNKSSASELPAVSSYNLDGGDSSALGALDSAGTDLLRVNTGARIPRPIGNFLTFHRRPS